MEAVARLVVSTAELIEAEGRSLRRVVLRTALALAVLLAAVVTMLLGLGFIAYGVFLLLARLLTVPGAALAVGVICVTSAVFAYFWYVRSRR